MNSLVGSVLKTARKKRGVSLQKTADALGLQSDAQIAHFESGSERIPFRHLRKLCEFLELDYDAVVKTWLEEEENGARRQKKEKQCRTP